MSCFFALPHTRTVDDRQKKMFLCAFGNSLDATAETPAARPHQVKATFPRRFGPNPGSSARPPTKTPRNPPGLCACPRRSRRSRTIAIHGIVSLAGLQRRSLITKSACPSAWRLRKTITKKRRLRPYFNHTAPQGPLFSQPGPAKKA